MVKVHNPDFVKVLSEDYMPMKVSDVKSLVELGKLAASLNRPRVKVLWPLETKLFGDEINSRKIKFKLDESKIQTFDKDTMGKYNGALFYSLRYFNGFSRLLIEYTRVNLKL